jgi:NIMA-interacting peptidyl-prolyl cis-trans isomerase 1
MSNSKKAPYFYNTTTKESRWDPPEELSEQEVKALPGVEHLGGHKASPAASGQMRASHLLVKHKGSRRPSSWKEVRRHLL